MPELIHQPTEKVRDLSGIAYRVLVYGEALEDGCWEGWLEFRPARQTGGVLRTGRGTHQPDKQSLASWASALETDYNRGAFARAM